MKRLIYIAACTLMALTSCQKDLLIPVNEGSDQRTEFSVLANLNTFENDSDMSSADLATKAVANAVVRLNWAAGDKISAINLTTGKALGGDLTAQESGASSHFSGSLIGTIRPGDQIAFIYPSQQYTEEQIFNGATIDLSRQLGTSAVPLAVYGTASMNGTDAQNMSIDFNYLMNYVQLNLAGLPSSQSISELAIEDMGAQLAITIEGGIIKCTPVSGTISVAPAAMSTNADGARTIYYATGKSDATAEKRAVTISVGTDNYKAEWTKSALGTGKYYTSIVSNWQIAAADFEVIFAQQATIGSGIDVVFLGDGYTNSNEDMRQYKEDMVWMKNAFLSMEPFKSHEAYFNLYSTLAISNEHKQYQALLNGAVDQGGNTKFGTRFTANSTHISGNHTVAFDFAHDSIEAIEGEAPSSERMNEILVVIMINAAVNAGTCVSYQYYWKDCDYGYGKAIGFFARETNEATRRATLLHEAGGHGFAKLDDEYSGWTFTPSANATSDERYQLTHKYHIQGWYKNVDAMEIFPTAESTSTIANMNPAWSDFLNNSIGSYSQIIADEQISTYEGAKTYENGFWRPTPNSIMNNHYRTTKFNAPSRRLIWYRIHKKADPSFVNDYSAFVAWDLAHQDQGIPLIDNSYGYEGNNSMMKTYMHEPHIVLEGTDYKRWR